MNTDIRYIFLDLGGTFRVIDKDPAYLATARAKIAELCGVKTEDPPRKRCCGGAGWPMTVIRS